MKKLIFTIPCLLLMTVFSDAQNSFGRRIVHELKVGEKMPNISLGKVINNHTGKTKFADFKGKLLILDFWYTGCASCIEGWPKLEQLQNQFGDKIQIILVNSYETQEQIERRLKQSYLKNHKMPNLPSIVDDKVLKSLFPHRFMGHNVWIDGKGIIRLLGTNLNTHEQKIKDLLAGKEISFMSNDTLSYYSNDTPLHKLNNAIETTIKYNSFFSGFNNQLEVFGGVWEKNIDSITHTVRNTYINKEVVDLYMRSIVSRLEPCWPKEIYIGNSKWDNKYLLFVTDTLKYTNQFVPSDKVTDDQIIKNSFCYEQIVPGNLEEEKQRQLMFEDLNRFFGDLYNVEVTIEKVKVPCFILKRTSNKDKIRTRNGGTSTNTVMVNGIKSIQFINYGLETAIASVAREIFKSSKQAVFVDETGYIMNIDILLPNGEGIKSIEEFRRFLKAYDLDIIKEERDLCMAVFKEKQFQEK